LGQDQNDEQMEKGIETIFGRDYELDFDDVLANMGSLDPKIDSVN